MIFQSCETIDSYFHILPLDWQETIVPFWKDLKTSTKAYVLLDDNQIIAGGLVFSQCPPDMLYARDEAEAWLNKGYLYVGFIYVIEEKRHQNLGSIWLDNLKKMFPKQKYWLTIEDLKLDTFYTKNGFKKVKSLNNHGIEEVLYTYVS
jgi:GNAT superfamily N-acetyltransferase